MELVGNMGAFAAGAFKVGIASVSNTNDGYCVLSCVISARSQLILIKAL